LFSGFLLKNHNIRRQTPNAINIKNPAPTIQTNFLVLKDLSAIAGIGAFMVVADGLLATFQGDIAGEGAIARGAGEAAGGDGMIVVLNGFPSFLQGKCYYN